MNGELPLFEDSEDGLLPRLPRTRRSSLWETASSYSTWMVSKSKAVSKLVDDDDDDMGMIVNIYMIFPNAQALQLPLGSLVPVLEVEIPRRSPRMPEVREVHCMNQTMNRYEKIWEAELKPEIRRQVYWATQMVQR